jgi:hypothetical protein
LQTSRFGGSMVPNKAPGFQGFNSYAAGRKMYGGGRSMPNIGPVSGQGQMGYMRDQKAAARKKALLRRLGGQMSGDPMSPKIMTSDSRGGY